MKYLALIVAISTVLISCDILEEENKEGWQILTENDTATTSFNKYTIKKHDNKVEVLIYTDFPSEQDTMGTFEVGNKRYNQKFKYKSFLTLTVFQCKEYKYGVKEMRYFDSDGDIVHERKAGSRVEYESIRPNTSADTWYNTFCADKN